MNIRPGNYIPIASASIIHPPLQDNLPRMKTRGKGSTKTAAEANEVTKSTAPKVQLAPESTNPPQILILPSEVSKEARIVTLQNPRYQTESRYLICPEKGIYEFSKIAASKTTPRSWLLASTIEEDGEPASKIKETNMVEGRGYIAKDAALFIATPIDPLFIILPALCPTPAPKDTESKKLFLSGEDYFDRLLSYSPHMRSFLQNPSIRSMVEGRMALVSDSVDGGEETMYRLSVGKLLEELLVKAKRMVAQELPASMESKFVRKVLEQPSITNVPEEESTVQEELSIPASGGETPETQTTNSTTTSFASEASTAATSLSEVTSVTSEPKLCSLPPITAPEGVVELLRIRTALLYICSAYIAPHMTEILKKQLETSSTINFKSLDDHLEHLAKLRQEALATRSLGDYSRKRGLDDDENEDKRAEKRRKDEEDKKRKANESRGVKALKKVNTSGMKKMSDFFKKK
jgi:hypothetical protein